MAPDVLAIEQGLRRLYVACEGGAVQVLEIEPAGSLKPLGKFDAPATHTIAVDQAAHRVTAALKDGLRRPWLWVLEPTK